MRNLTPSWMLPTGLACLTLYGCGQQSPADVAREKVVLATDQVADAYQSATELKDADRVYTVADERQGVKVEADFSAEAFEQDRLNAMVPGLQSSATGAGPLQQYTIARTLASIHRQDAHYLTGRGADGFDPIRARLIANQVFYQQMQLVNAQITELQANREQIIQTLQTGEMGEGLNLQEFVRRLRNNAWGGTVQVAPSVRLEDYEDAVQYASIQGIDDIEQSEASLEAEIDQTRTQLIAYLDEIDALLRSSAKNSELSQDLVAEASELTGSMRYDKLDQAIRVQYEALGEQTQAETQIIFAQAAFSRMGLSLGDMIDPVVFGVVYTTLNQAGDAPAAMIAFGRSAANVKSSAFAEYQARIAQDPDNAQAGLGAAEQRAYFDQQVEAGVAFAGQFQVIEQGSDVAGSLAALRAVLDASKTPGDLANLRQTITQIEKRIAEVRAEQARASADLQKSEALRAALVEGDSEVPGFIPTLTELDAQMQVLVMQRYEGALEAIALAEAALSGATPTSQLQASHSLDLLSTYLQHVRIQHDYLVALQTYRSLLQSYIAEDVDGNVSGELVLTDSVVDKLQELTTAVDAKIQALQAEASTQGESFRNTVRAHLDQTTAAAGNDSTESTQAQAIGADLAQLWGNMTGTAAPAPQPAPEPEAEGGTEPEVLTPQ